MACRATGILVLDDVLFEEERECIFALQFNPLLEPEECLLTTLSLFLGPFILKGLIYQTVPATGTVMLTMRPARVKIGGLLINSLSLRHEIFREIPNLRPKISLSLSSDHIPVCFPFPPSPSSGGHGSVRFAFVVRLEAQNSAARRKGPRSPTIGTLHKRDTTLLKTHNVNGNHPEKRAFDQCGGRDRDLLPRSSLIRLFCW